MKQQSTFTATKNLYFALLIMFIGLGVNNTYAQICPSSDVSISSQADLEQFANNYPDCTIIEGDLTIAQAAGESITDLSALSNIERIDGYLSISGIDQIESLNSFENLNEVYDIQITSTNFTNISFPLLNTVEVWIIINDNSQLLNLNFDELEELDGVIVHDNNALININSFNKIETLNHCQVKDNSNLQEITGFTLLRVANDALALENNPALIDISGFGNIESLEALSLINNGLTDYNQLSNLNFVLDLWIGGHPELLNINFLSNISNGLALLSIGNNPKLSSLEGLNNIPAIGWVLNIRENDILNDISALENLNIEYLESLFIVGNPELSNCNIASVCDFISISDADYDISGNKSGCTTAEEIDCDNLVNTEETIPVTELFVYPNPATDFITVEYVQNATILSITDLGGRIVNTMDLRNRNDSTIRVNIQDLNSGIYILSILDQETGTRFRQKLIKQ